MARFRLGCLASLTILCVAGAAPLGAQDNDYGVAQTCPHPTGKPPIYQYPDPSSEYRLPAPSQGDLYSPSDSGSLPDAPPSPSRPVGTSQTPPLNTQPPQLATPTFMPSAGRTTATSSAGVAAPNMIGDLFGTSFSGAVPIVIDNFFAFGSLTDIGGAPDLDITSPLTYSATNPDSTLYIGRSTDPMSALSTIPMFSLTGSTTATQSAIASADPSLSSPVGIANNAAVQAEVSTLGTGLHGPGGATFVPGSSSLELNPTMPLVPPMLEVSPEGIWNYNYIVLSEAAGLSNPGAAPGSMVGRQKISENSSPRPQDRVFVNYSYFSKTPLTDRGLNVNRVTPGFEKTLFDGNFSVEVRAPFATTLDSDITAGGLTDSSSVEFGNLTVYFKALLWDAGVEAISAGVGFSFPTADDVNLTLVDGTPLLDIKNESIHVLPFIGALFMPTEKVFIQAFLQADLDPNGNSLRFSEFPNGVPNGNLLPVGRPSDADYIFFDVGLGYWIYQAPVNGPCCCEECSSKGHGWIRGIAPTVELHYNGTINQSDVITAARGNSFVQIGDSSRTQIDLWNAVLGATIEFRNNAQLTIGYATPVSGNADEQFDSELRVMFNWFFGGSDHVKSCRYSRL